MNKLRKALVLVAASLSIGGLAGCDIIDKLIPGEQQTEKKNFEGLTLENATVTYDGQPHSISVTGNLPEGAQVSYGQAGNSFTEVGQHSIQAVISAEGYNDLSLSAVLTIVNADFAGLTLSDSTVTYDGQAHSIEVAGELPAGAEVSYGDGGNTFTAPGVYNISATITCNGYTTLNLEAVLTINKASFENVVFENMSVEYDGQPHTIEATVPETYITAGASVTYSQGGNTFTKPGYYPVTVTVSLENYEDFEKTAALTIGDAGVATEEFKIADFEDIETDADLNDVFKLTFNKDGTSWIVPSAAKMTLEDTRVMGFKDANKVMKVALTHQGYAFRVEKDISESFNYQKFTGLSLDAFMDDREAEGIMKLSFNLWLRDLPLPDQFASYRNTYISFTIDDACSGVWTHYDIPFTDESMKIAELDHETSVFALSQAGVSIEDLTPYIEKVSINIKQNGIANGNCFAYFDNIELNRKTEKARTLSIFDGMYGFVDDSERLVAIDVSEDFTAASFKVNDVEEAQLKVEKNGNTVVFEDKANNGAGLTVTAEITDKGGMHVTGVEGAAQAMYAYLNGATANKIANLNYDLQDKNGNVGNPLSDMNWYQEKENNGWVKATNQMNVRKYSTNIYGNMVTGYGMTNRYTYRNDKNIGLANKFSVDIANDFSGAQGIRLKIKLIPFAGADQYIAGGDGDNWYMVEPNVGKRESLDQWEKLSFNFDPVQVKAVSFILKGLNGSAAQYFYFDNVKLSFVPAGYPAVTGVEVTPSELSLDVYNNATGNLSAVVNGTNSPSQEVTWKSSDPTVATVDATGKVTALKAAASPIIITATSVFDPAFKGTCSVTVTDSTPAPTIHTVEDGKYYIWNGNTDAFRLEIGDSQTTGSVQKLGGDSYAVTVSVNGNEVTFKDATGAGAYLTIVANIEEDNLMKVTSVNGALASTFSGSLLNKYIRHCADASLNFSDGTVDQYYQEAHWTESKYQSSGWSAYAAPTDMRSKQDKNGNKVVNMHCNSSAKNFLYTPDLPFGPINHVSVDLGNYWGSSAGTLRYKMAILDKDGNLAKYVAGDASNWATLEKDTSSGNICKHFEFDVALVVGYKLRITTSMQSGEAYLYMDNLQVNYKAA